MGLVDLHVEVYEFGCWDRGIDPGDSSFDGTGCSDRVAYCADVEGQIGKDGARILQRAYVGIWLSLLAQVGLFAVLDDANDLVVHGAFSEPAQVQTERIAGGTYRFTNS